MNENSDDSKKKEEESPIVDALTSMGWVEEGEEEPPEVQEEKEGTEQIQAQLRLFKKENEKLNEKVNDLKEKNNQLREKNEMLVEEKSEFLEKMEKKNEKINNLLQDLNQKTSEDSDLIQEKNEHIEQLETQITQLEETSNESEVLNQKLKEMNIADIPKKHRPDARQHYSFDLLTPALYDQWFSGLRKGKL